MPWVQQELEIPYRLGFWSVARVHVPALLQANHFAAILKGETIALPSRSELKQAGARVAYIPSCPIEEAWPMLSYVDGWIRYIACRYPHYYIQLDGDFESYLKKHVGSSTRATARRKVRLMAKESGGTIDWREYHTPEEAEVFLENARKISENSYQEKYLGRSIRDHEADIRRFASEGKLRCWLLFLKEQPIAFQYARMLTEDIMIEEWRGYNNEMSKSSPGMVLDYMILGKLFSEGELRYIDLTEGEAYYKKTFATANRLCGDVYYFRPGVRNAAVVGSHASFGAAYGVASDVLERYDLKTKVKRLFRK